MAFTNVWDTTVPADTELANLLGQNLRDFRLDVQQRMAAISGLDAAKPDLASDAQPTNWAGMLFFATDTGKIYQFSGSAWVDKTADLGFIVKKFYTVTGSTSSNGQTLTTITVPAAMLKAGSKIDLIAAVTYSAVPPGCTIYLDGVTSTIVLTNGSGSTVIGEAVILVLDNTTVVIGDVNAFATQKTVDDLSVNPLVITLVQSGAGTLANVYTSAVVSV